MDETDWRDELEPHSRKKSVKRIMNAVRQYHHLDDDELHELEKFSQSRERKICAIATSLVDYRQQITTVAVSMESKSPNLTVMRMIQTLKEKYLPDLNEMYRRIAYGLQQLASHLQQAESDKHEKLKMSKAMLEDFIPFLRTSRSEISQALKEKLVFYEKQIINFIDTHRPRVLSLQPGQVPSPRPPSHPLKIQMLQEMYLPELDEIHQRMADKVGQLDSYRQQAGPVSCRMVNMFKAMMERNIAVLQASRSNISPTLGEELPFQEKQIMHFIDMGRLVPASHRASVMAESSGSSSSSK